MVTCNGNRARSWANTARSPKVLSVHGTLFHDVSKTSTRSWKLGLVKWKNAVCRFGLDADTQRRSSEFAMWIAAGAGGGPRSTIRTFRSAKRATHTATHSSHTET
jgi:hypothetical protein